MDDFLDIYPKPAGLVKAGSQVYGLWKFSY